MGSFKEYMAEEKKISRWLILIIGLIGMFCGATLSTVYYFGLIVL